MGTTERDYTKQPQCMLFIQLKYTSMKNDISEMQELKNIKYNPPYFSALVHASDCPDNGYRIPLFLLAFGIIGVFTAIMIFFSNSLWSDSEKFQCFANKNTQWFVQMINLVLAFIMFVFVFLGE